MKTKREIRDVLMQAGQFIFDPSTYTTEQRDKLIHDVKDAHDSLNESLGEMYDAGGEECFGCGKEDYEQDMTEHDGKLYCDTCAEELFEKEGRWLELFGLMPGEPFLFLDGDEENAKAAVVELDTEKEAKYEVRLAGGELVGTFADVDVAKHAAEKKVDGR